MTKLWFPLFCSLVLLTTPPANAEGSKVDPYKERVKALNQRKPANRRVPVIPPKGEKIRVLIDTDAKNEIDDVWALALALLAPERFQIEGIVSANYDNSIPDAGPRSVEASAEIVHEILEHAGFKGQIPVKLGSAPMRYNFEPSESEGVDFIIEKAMASTPENPLWIVGLGAATNLASAYLKEPRIADRVIAFWHFRTRWPKQCWNFNVFGDVRATRLIFHSDLPFVLFDTGTDLTCSMEESEQYKAYGSLGQYMHDYRSRDKYFQGPKKGFFDLGDIAALIDPDLAKWEVVECPEVDWDLSYRFKKTKGSILRCYAIDRDKTFALLHQKLKESAPKQHTENEP